MADSDEHADSEIRDEESNGVGISKKLAHQSAKQARVDDSETKTPLSPSATEFEPQFSAPELVQVLICPEATSQPTSQQQQQPAQPLPPVTSIVPSGATLAAAD